MRGATAWLLVLATSAAVAGWLESTEQEGERLFRDGHYAEAAKVFRDPYRRGVAQYRAGEYAEAARSLKPARRRALLCFFGTHGGLRYVDSNVIVTREPGCLGEDAIVAVVRELAQLARCLVHSVDAAAPGERDPQPGRAMDAPIPEAPDPAGTVWEPVAEEAVPAPAPEMTVAAAAAPEATEPAAGVDADAVCAALFDPKLSTYDTRRVFERDFRGKKVAWQGTLAAVEQSSYDPELGEEPGVKATFEIGAVVSALGDSERVQAAVRFAPDAIAALDARRGARAAFLGTLAGVDGVSRTVYVGDGRLAS